MSFQFLIFEFQFIQRRLPPKYQHHSADDRSDRPSSQLALLQDLPHRLKHLLRLSPANVLAPFSERVDRDSAA